MLNYCFLIQLIFFAISLFIPIPLIITILPTIILMTEVTTMAIMDYIIFKIIKLTAKDKNFIPYIETKKELKKKFLKTSYSKINKITCYNINTKPKRKDLHK